MTTSVTLKSLAQELGIDRSNFRRYILSKGIEFHKVRTPESRGQQTLALSLEDADLIRKFRANEGFIYDAPVSKPIQNGLGYFYVIQTIPELLPNRVKLGFATNPQIRLNAHRTAAPTAEIVYTHPCKRYWEATIIDSITRIDCVLVGGEVFDCDNLDTLLQRCKEIFALLPS